jgi:hypothetical protein
MLWNRKKHVFLCSSKHPDGWRWCQSVLHMRRTIHNKTGKFDSDIIVHYSITFYELFGGRDPHVTDDLGARGRASMVASQESHLLPGSVIMVIYKLVV